MNILRSLCMAFSMYSKIPVFKVKWEEKNMKYALCFFPLVGVVIGACEIAVFLICARFNVNFVLRAAIMSALPTLISGGIHMDGFIDTSDALASCADRERKLEILKDAHIGAFAVINAVVYYMLFFGFMCGIDTVLSAVVCSTGFVLSRALSALTLCHFNCARESGLLRTFGDASQKTALKASSWIFIVLCLGFAALINPAAAALTATAQLAALWRYVSVKRKFGGITGDTAGYFVCVSELFIVMAGGVICVLL